MVAFVFLQYGKKLPYDLWDFLEGWRWLFRKLASGDVPTEPTTTVLNLDRRTGTDRRSGHDRRQHRIPVTVERRSGVNRRRSERRARAGQLAAAA